MPVENDLIRGTTAIELHDSEVSFIWPEETKLRIILSPAIVHRSEGIPGTDPGTVWTQDAVMVFQDCELSGIIPQLPCALADGMLHSNGSTQENVINVPLSTTGQLQIILSFETGTEIQITARNLHLTLCWTPKYLETFE